MRWWVGACCIDPPLSGAGQSVYEANVEGMAFERAPQGNEGPGVAIEDRGAWCGEDRRGTVHGPAGGWHVPRARGLPGSSASAAAPPPAPTLLPSTRQTHASPASEGQLLCRRSRARAEAVPDRRRGLTPAGDRSGGFETAGRVFGGSTSCLCRTRPDSPTMGATSLTVGTDSGLALSSAPGRAGKTLRVCVRGGCWLLLTCRCVADRPPVVRRPGTT